MQLFFGRRANAVGALTLTLALIAPLAGSAQDEPNTDSNADGAGVARISFIDGSVAVQRGDADDSFRATLNTPLLGGDYLTTGADALAEIEIDGDAEIRLGPDAQMRFNHLDDSNHSVQLAAGTLDLHLMHGTDGSNVIDTPSIEVKPRTSGTYRVSVTPDGQTLVTVRSGYARIDTPQGGVNLQPGTTLLAQGDPADPSIQINSAIAVDGFDHFNVDRDRADTPAVADAGFVNAGIGGVEDLDTYGRWVNDGAYGHVWVPASVGADWAPYRNGRWVWEAGYGWTWLASEPWGWAPYHYGSWYNSPNYGWCWYPPQPRVYVPWRPALVAFIGFGGGSGLSLSFGGGDPFSQIGWVPLAPFEPYHPWWGNGYAARGGVEVNNITRVTNITNITNTYVYKNVQYNGASSVSSQRFLQGDFAHNVAVRAAQLRGAQAFHGALPVVPTASNLRFSAGGERPPVAVHPALMQRTFAGNAAATRRIPFTSERVALAMATHAAVTPLHFRDAASTPIVPDQKLVRSGSQAVRTETPPKTAHASAAAQPARSSSLPVQPAAPGGSTGAWARFDATRYPQQNSGREPSTIRLNDTPASPNTSHTPAANVYHAPPAANVYHAPPAANVYHAPPAANVYHAPPAANVYHAPPAANVYHAPPAANVYHAPPAANVYHAPPAANVYHAPPAANVYHAPPAANVYHAPPADVYRGAPIEHHASSPKKTDNHAAPP